MKFLDNLKKRLPTTQASAVAHIARNKVFSISKGVLDTTTEIAKEINKIGTAPGVHNYIALSTIALRKLLDMNRLDPSADSRFVQVYFPCIDKILIHLSELQVPEKNCYKEGSGTIMKMWPFPGEYGDVLLLRTNGQELDCFYLERGPDTLDRIKAHIGNAIWRIYGSNLEIYLPSGYHSLRITLNSWENKNPLPSMQSKILCARTCKFLEAGHSRGIMLHGPPGTGKSMMARYLAKELSTFVALIHINAKSYHQKEIISFCMQVLRPEVVIVDDLDHVPNPVGLLETLDKIREYTKLLIVTVNDKEKFPKAALRVGRIDEIYQVDRILYPQDILPEIALTEEMVEAMNDWPISFVEEFGRRVRTLGVNSIQEEFDNLVPRVAENLQKENAELGKKES